MLRVEIRHPSAAIEHDILKLNQTIIANTFVAEQNQIEIKLSPESIRDARIAVINVHMAPALEHYLVNLVVATREPDKSVKALAGLVRLGASPRATLALDRGARALAWLDGRDYVLPEDIHALAADVLCHRLIMSFEAQANSIQARDVVAALIESMPVP
jgi:MoxR-like ATPase